MNSPTETNANHEPLSALDIYARFRERLRSLPKTAPSTGDGERVSSSPAYDGRHESFMEASASQPSQSPTPLDWRVDGNDEGRPTRKPPVVHIPPKSRSHGLEKKNETNNDKRGAVELRGIHSLVEEDEAISEDELREFLSKLDWNRLHE